MKLVNYIGIGLCLVSCAQNNENHTHKYREIRDLTAIVWNADTLVKHDGPEYKPLYRIILPDSTTDKDLIVRDTITGQDRFFPVSIVMNVGLSFRKMENETLDMKINMLKAYNRFLETKDYNDGIKAIAYSQYLAARFPGVDGKELENSAKFIVNISKELKRIDNTRR